MESSWFYQIKTSDLQSRISVVLVFPVCFVHKVFQGSFDGLWTFSSFDLWFGSWLLIVHSSFLEPCKSFFEIFNCEFWIWLDLVQINENINLKVFVFPFRPNLQEILSLFDRVIEIVRLFSHVFYLTASCCLPISRSYFFWIARNIMCVIIENSNKACGLIIPNTYWSRDVIFLEDVGSMSSWSNTIIDD